MAWLLPSSLCARASADLSLDLQPPEQTPELYAGSSGTVQRRPASWRGWKTRAWKQRLYGAAISLTSITLRSLVEFLASPRGSRANRGRLRGQGKGLKTSATSSVTSATPFLWWDPVKSSWRTCQVCLLPGLDTFSGPWPKWGMMLSGEVFELPAGQAPATAGNGSLSWQTPGTDSFRSRGGDRKNEAGLDQQARHWPTPRASANENRTTRNAPSHGKTHGKTLAGEAGSWPTPAASVANDRETPETWEARAMRLKAKHNNSNGAGKPLTVAACQFPFSLQVRETPGGQRYSDRTRRLNPRFVELLMGMPPSWTCLEPTDSQPLEMASYLRRLHSHISNLTGD